MKLCLLMGVAAHIFIQSVHSYSILFALPFSGKSHYLNVKPIIQELANRGHNVTVLAPFAEKNPNYRQVIATRRMIWESLDNPSNIFVLETWSFKMLIDFVWIGMHDMLEAVFETPAVMEFVKRDDSHYDLIFFEYFYNEAMYMFMHKYKAPAVGFSTIGAAHYVASLMGSPIVTSHMPHEFLSYGSGMSFYQRLENVAALIYDLYWRKKYHFPMQQRLADKYFNHLPGPLPRLEELEKNISVSFVNTHFSYDAVRPNVPGLIDVGGVHIKEPKDLPQNLKKFLDDAKDGAIYFSLGSNIQSKDMSQDKIDLFLDVFGQLKQRVLWKWEDENLPNSPNNLMTGKWMPQNDILAHPNVKIFITHGGLLSTQESMHHGVPVITLPFYGDQHMNAKRITNIGFGITLSYKNLDSNALKTAIGALINNPIYQQRAKDISSRFKDRPNTAMDTVIYWIDYVIKHKGASFIRSPAVGMSGFVYYSFDIALFVIVSIFLVVLFLYFVISYLFRKNSIRVQPENNKKKN